MNGATPGRRADSFGSPDARTCSGPVAAATPIVVTAEAVTDLAKEFWQKALTIEADPFGTGQLAAADIGRAVAYRDASKRLLALAADADLDARAEAGEDWNAPDRDQAEDDEASYRARRAAEEGL